GAYGVIVPMVNNRAEAEQAVSACRYPPKGNRSFGPIRGAVYGGGGGG
ncbi:MAG TPA: 2,4-dihydroxyhept-2-ene-1,7-dioic acid aldolase, partial [Gammaproteobacteria bacterium]|nr:2,4-dihydroxyhept-2-ene-1,7-dioic acid aldolase [Gammaproteobacteria bacterium]